MQKKFLQKKNKYKIFVFNFIKLNFEIRTCGGKEVYILYKSGWTKALPIFMSNLLNEYYPCWHWRREDVTADNERSSYTFWCAERTHASDHGSKALPSQARLSWTLCAAYLKSAHKHRLSHWSFANSENKFALSFITIFFPNKKKILENTRKWSMQIFPNLGEKFDHFFSLIIRKSDFRCRMIITLIICTDLLIHVKNKDFDKSPIGVYNKFHNARIVFRVYL